MKKLNRKTLKNIIGEIGIELNLPLPVGVCLGNLLSLCPPHSHCRADERCYPDAAGPCINGLCPSGYHCHSGECVR
ncbi:MULTISPECIES: hypothetical protein [Chryseobacterium]|jgi:hypothetical protein|uniref:CC domain-containing protein n=1 Tax=Chryseobacterium flavum TaxID=415851 RepID=A0A3D9CHQ3_9FLAO|nr:MULTISPECIES: hypothetical protein [Chryseobacterium]MBO9691057.1 hypothetical protein [Chryseobacterium sp.]MCD9615665.1 hypothetical protein [Chryseobacterium gleum]REC65272.1 hypothetical protein DRF59_16960 [Chryseobacterium flavum]